MPNPTVALDTNHGRIVGSLNEAHLYDEFVRDADLKKKPVQKVETLETIDLEIKQAEAKLEELKAKREEFKATNAEKLKARKAELEAELAAMEDIE